jgi:hypothetical protein
MNITPQVKENELELLSRTELNNVAAEIAGYLKLTGNAWMWEGDILITDHEQFHVRFRNHTPVHGDQDATVPNVYLWDPAGDLNEAFGFMDNVLQKINMPRYVIQGPGGDSEELTCVKIEDMDGKTVAMYDTFDTETAIVICAIEAYRVFNR